MSDDTDTTRWSLPGQMDVPRDELKVQMEVYDETILLRGFEDGANWVRTVSADAIASAFTQRLGCSSGLLPKETLWWSQGETGQAVALWRPPKVWPVALQREAFKPPARLRVPMPGLVFVCSPGRALWVYAAKSRPAGAEQPLYRAPAFNIFADGRVCPRQPHVPRRGRDDTRLLLPVLLLDDGGHPGSLQETLRQPVCTMGGARWQEEVPD